jgi:nitroimidazol reductase NimA-like FMN-containing flavoprotein (pyridoxamine 5'-phosphate oxidase superfamily)
MLITRMRSKECREFLDRSGLGRLACVSNNRPYIVPIYFAFDADRLYSFSTLGQKILWMRQNPLVCLEADEIRAHDDWESVVVLGRYVEISGGPDGAKARRHVRSLLERRPLWWQTGYTATQVRRASPRGSQEVEAIYFCILVEKMTGLRGSPDMSETRKNREACKARP